MPYTQPTLAQAQIDMGNRLNDSGFVHWTTTELQIYLIEALRVWNAWTAHWRDRGSFTAVMGQAFYDLPTELPTLRGHTVTNWNVVQSIQYALLESPTPDAWSGTDQFTLTQVSQAIQRRRDQFLRETGAVVTRSLTPYTATASGRYDLDEAVLIVRRAAWRPDATQLLLPLLRTDAWAATHFAPAWPQQTGAPQAYSVSTVPPLQIQIIDPPATDGSLDMVSINKGATLVPNVQSVLGIPDDWAWVVKYGALADLLQGDGLALDPARSAYCESRWQQGLEMAKKAPVVLAARINEVTVRIGSLADADSYSPTWQLLAGVPREPLLAGQNLLALSPPPGGGVYTVLLDVVRNAPIPQDPVDILQVSQDVYDSILDYAQHIALAKEGPGELELSMALLERASRAAGVDLHLQQASQPSRNPLLRQQQQDQEAVARELPAVEVG